MTEQEIEKYLSTLAESFHPYQAALRAIMGGIALTLLGLVFAILDPGWLAVWFLTIGLGMGIAGTIAERGAQ